MNNTDQAVCKEIVKVETMRSRERVIKTTNHQPVDRMPIDLGFHYSTGISAFAYQKLREYLGLPTDKIEIIDMDQFLARVDIDVLERFHCDCILLNPGALKTKEWNPRERYRFQVPNDINLQQQTNCDWAILHQSKSVMPNGGFFFDSVPDRDPTSEDEHIEQYAKEAERIYKDTDYYTMYIGYHAYFNCVDIEEQCRMLTDPDVFLEDTEYIHKKQLRSLKKVIDRMGNHIQAVALNADLGSQQGPLCNPHVFDDLCAPFIKQFCDYVHQNSNLKVFLHSCGSIRRFIPTLIDCGIDIFNPVQITAAEMDPAELKHAYGDMVTFWGGGCNTQQVLGGGTPEQVADNVRELTRIFKPGGGFVFNQVHNIMGNVKPENIVAMLDTAYEESFY